MTFPQGVQIVGARLGLFESPTGILNRDEIKSLSSLGGKVGATVSTNRLRRRDISINSLLASHEFEGLCVMPAERCSEDKQKTLAALLICAQEEERSRIARELHDDIAQQLALICIDIDRIRTSASRKSSLDGLRKVVKIVESLGLRVRTLSHELHSPQLDLLGLGSAISMFCQKFGTAHRMDVICDCSGLTERLANDISLCMYRVTQEALQNVAKHSGARRALVNLHADKDEVLLRIQDFGCGFQMESVGCMSGMGLRSMRERIRLVGGNMVVHSTPGEGTTIEARVGLAAYR